MLYFIVKNTTMHNLTICLFIIFCALQFVVLAEKNEGKKLLSINLKSAFFIIAAAASLSKVGKTVYFLFAMAIIVAASLHKKPAIE